MIFVFSSSFKREKENNIQLVVGLFFDVVFFRLVGWYLSILSDRSDRPVEKRNK